MVLVEVCGREGNGRRTVRPPVLNSGSGTINGEEGGRPWKSKGSLPSEPAQCKARMLPGEPAHWRTACTPFGQPAHRTALARLPFSQGQAAVRTAPPTAIKTKTRGVTLMVNRTHMV